MRYILTSSKIIFSRRLIKKVIEIVCDIFVVSFMSTLFLFCYYISYFMFQKSFILFLQLIFPIVLSLIYHHSYFISGYHQDHIIITIILNSIVFIYRSFLAQAYFTEDI